MNENAITTHVHGKAKNTKKWKLKHGTLNSKKEQSRV